jgi:hypothetical protein
VILFKVSMDAGLFEDVNYILASDRRNIWNAKTDSGLGIVFTHATASGELSAYPYLDKDRLIVCCYPARVKARYPYLKVVGNWDEPTAMRWCEETKNWVVTPKSKLYQANQYIEKHSTGRG